MLVVLTCFNSDTLRQRNGNLEISLCQQETGPAGL